MKYAWDALEGSSELVEGRRVVTLALCELVHVVLAARDVVLVSLKAADEPLAVVSAGVVCRLLLLGVLLLLGLSVLLLLHGGGLLLGRLAAAVARASAHHSAHALVSNLRASAEGHAGGHCAHEATAHTTGGGGRRLGLGCGARWGRGLTGWGAGAAAKEAAATAAA